MGMRALFKQGIVAAACVLGCVGFACQADTPLRFRIGEACDQNDLAAVKSFNFRVSNEAGELLSQARWRASSAGGELADVPSVARAVISVVGRDADDVGVVGGAVGVVDLVERAVAPVTPIGIAVGKVDAFMRVSDVRTEPSTCSEMVARRGHTATALGDGRVLILGGDKIKQGGSTFWETSEIYDPQSGAFVDGPATPGGRRDHTATRLSDGRVLVAGGYTAADATMATLPRASVYEPDAAELSGAVALLQARRSHTATRLPDGRVLLAGGYDQTGVALRSTEIFDPATATSEPGPILLHGRAGHAAVLVGPFTVAVIGGDDGQDALASVEFASVLRTEAFAGPDLSVPRTRPMAALIEGTDAVVVAGGLDHAPSEGLLRGTATLDIVRIDRTSYADSTLVCEGMRLLTPRGDGVVAKLPAGFLFAGGIDDQGQTLGSAETLQVGDLDACDLRFELTAGELSAPRAGARASALADGDILLTGGYAVASGGGQPVTLGAPEIYVRRR